MENTIHTLQEYMLHTETTTYIIIVAALIGITFFFRFAPVYDIVIAVFVGKPSALDSTLHHVNAFAVNVNEPCAWKYLLTRCN